jgi:FkbM family methyltransferase
MVFKKGESGQPSIPTISWKYFYFRRGCVLQCGAAMVAIRETVSKVPILRPLAIGLLRLTKTDIRIANPWTKHSLFLNSFHHKSYWFFGKVRENATMLMLAKCIATGDTVIEIGGHIGFISQYLSKLVGRSGRVIVFEPGSNNLSYIRKNLRNLPNVTLVEVAISNICGTTRFYEDNVTGQNNSLLPNYENAEAVAKSNGVRLKKHVAEVPVTTLDAYVQAYKLSPDFIKMDIEGAELNALLGSTSTLAHVRGLMIEVTRNHAAVASLLRERGFQTFSAEGEELLNLQFSGNIFALRACPDSNDSNRPPR